MDPYPSFFTATSKMVETSKSSYLMNTQLSSLSPGALPGECLLEQFQDVELCANPLYDIILYFIGSFDSLPKLIVDSAFRCEPEIQAGLIANLVVTGGNSCFEGVSCEFTRH
jgi:hypothetical protein